MTSSARRPSPAVRKPPLRHRLHRITGITTGLVLLYLIGTGLPLQLTGELDLGSRYVATPAVLDWYGIGAPASGWQSGGVTYVGGLVFSGRQPVIDADGFQGAVTQGDLSAVAAGEVLLIFPPSDPDLVDSVRLPAPALRIGRHDGDIVIDTALGLQVLSAQTLTLSPLEAAVDGVEWAHLTTLTGDGLAPFAAAARARVLTVERLLQDLHSGRAFGPAGEWLVGLASLALSVLAVSGFWIWWRSR
ncbi:MAG: PepSY domain-containing protein [Pseudomonadales bacterium]